MKKYIIVCFLLFLTNCSAPGSALLGPVYTGATTGSLSQASLSYGTNHVIREVRKASKKSKNEFDKIVRKFEKISADLRHKNLIEFDN